ncbi:MAG: hypothetical protein IJ343_13660 [Clostridia bacterium]|nr:hypothetical protein [Clostridia bacterium]
MFRIAMADVERCSAWRSRDRVVFTYEDSLRFQRVRKRNTSFFDALTDVCGLPYRVSEGVLTELLYETLVVDLSQPEGGSYARCLQPDGCTSALLPTEELQRTIFRCGVAIENVPGRSEPVIFVPFIASASMSREGEYLFINRERLDAMLRAVSLDMVCGSDEYVPVISGLPRPDMADVTHVGLEESEKHIAPPKLAAYLGLSLSDGVSVRELLAAREARRAAEWMPDLPEIDALPEEDAALQAQPSERSAWLLGLNASNTICVNDWDEFDMKLSGFNCCWVNRELPLPARVLPLPEKYRRAGAALPAPTALAEAFGTFAALAGKDERAKAEASGRFDELLGDPESGIWAAWRQAAEDFFVAPGMLDLERGPIPLPAGAAEAQADLNTFAFLYAAVPSLTNGRREFRREASGVQRGVVSVAQLHEAINEYRTSVQARRRLWRTLERRQASRCRMISAQTVAAGVRMEAGTPDRSEYRTELRHIAAGSPMNRGKLSDGCGFMEPVLFDRLETLLRGRPRREDEEPINAVQLRLPWCKGLLVRFSFNAYLRQQAQEQDADVRGLTMKDVYGCQRPLFDAEGRARIRVLFTDSMFKGANWFRQLEGGHDCWALYWERLRAHGASVLIAGKSTPSGMESRLNYQFLSTVGMKPEEAWELADKRLKLLAKGRNDDAVMARLLAGAREDEEDETDELREGPVETLWEETDEPPEADEDGEALDGDAYSALFSRLVRKYPERMKQTAWVSSRYNSLVQSEIVQLMRGRLPVEGDVRYVLPDLLAMSRYIARELVYRADGRTLTGNAVVSPINRFDADAPQGCYYAPGRQTPWTWRRPDRRGEPMEVAVLRNPHYASGEEPVLQPLPPEDMKEYNRWFGMLTGCLMAPCSALMTLNGADSDGDRVNVCAQQSVVRAIRRRAAQTGQLLQQVVKRRKKLTGWLKHRAKEETRRETARYLELLAAELEEILPASLRVQPQESKYSPPLLYAGSEAKGAKYSRQELQGLHLRDRLWETFCLSRRQEIGRMSLDMLGRAADAYAETDECFTDKTPLPRLLSAFMTRYLAVSDALDTALEIDMAKTGMSHSRPKLKEIPADVKALFGVDRGCGFRRWRTLYLRYKPRLSGRDFPRAMEEMMTEFTGQPPRLLLSGWRKMAPELRYARSCMAGGRKPLAAAARCRNAPEPALMIDGLPEQISRMWRCRRKALSKHSHQRLHALLRNPVGEPSAALLARAQTLAMAYERGRQAVRAAAYGERTIHRSYQDMLHWLLGNGFALDEAVTAVGTLMQMLARWQEEAADGLGDLLRALSYAARDTQNAAAWGWANAAGRRLMLNRLLDEAATRVGLEAAQRVTVTEQERSLLTCSSRSIQLLQHTAEYGRRRAGMDERGRLGGVTPDWLEAELRTLADGSRETYYALCWKLGGTTWKSGGRSCYYLGDFLTAYLLRELLEDRINEREGRT